MAKTNKKVDKREAHIKKKLTAAIMMLLISCIMTVTSTYAWFTLSTAPEIKGVSTTVGANGNLEIALATTETWASPEEIMSGANTSGNYTSWGNMVDLSSTEFGLNTVKLYPAQLNAIEEISGEESINKLQSLSAILKTPAYGVDGRVTSVTANTVTGVYENTGFEVSDARGVRAIGRALNLTPRQIAYRNALDAILNYQSAAASKIKTSFVQNGNGGYLSSLAISMVGGSSATTEVSENQFNAVNALLSALEGALLDIEDSVIAAIDGYAASGAMRSDANLSNDNIYIMLHNELYPTEGDYSLLTHITTDGSGEATKYYLSFTNVTDQTSLNLELTGALKTMITSLIDMDTDVKAARTNLPTSYSDTVNFGTLKTTLGYLINVVETKDNENKVISSTVTVGGHTPTELKALAADMDVSKISDDLTVSLNEGSGIYYDIASFVGNFHLTVTIPEGTVVAFSTGDGEAKVKVGGMPVPIKSNYTGSATKLEAAKTAVNEAGSPSSDGSTDAATISDTYGYAIDFLVRTNASNSNLLLSTEAVNRVGGTDASEATMGAGSLLTINSRAENISVDTLRGLLECLRVVFVDEAGVILREARFDVNTFTDGENVSLKLWTPTKTVLSCTDTTEGHTHNDNCPTTTVAGHFAEDDDVITELPTNIAYKLTAIVYLDGEAIDNADVTNAASSFIGTLNLQFASSAELVPMRYSGYNVPENTTPGGNEQGGGTGTNTEPGGEENTDPDGE